MHPKKSQTLNLWKNTRNSLNGADPNALLMIPSDPQMTPKWPPYHLLSESKFTPHDSKWQAVFNVQLAVASIDRFHVLPLAQIPMSSPWPGNNGVPHTGRTCRMIY